ncbi:GNAT superfamily N-acetyltransferase [Kitasatospora gansuensis]|uniref:GNAT superfamily N-acetyltransferase n=1 Tax=Kitasatospora gansuensis TaxID=258050 RepID=A0A7W7SBZ2_9ACTN|nr:GNAT family N-acetyltransferase [Kitasatospora gansuensis]MBB4947212.1 GNAT superfamily N-acetyltransferase [Kitasatospora gansuensis]
MTWTLSSSLDDFRTQAGDFLAAHPAENTVLLTLVHNLTEGGPHVFGPDDPQYGWWRPGPDAPVVGAFVRTPPYPLRLGLMPERAATELALALAGTELTAVDGGVAPAQAFAAAWQQDGTVKSNERLYRLGKLVDPSPLPAGTVRLATANDVELLVEWFGAFVAEAELAIPGENHRPTVERRTADGRLHIWEHQGTPVSFAGVSPVIAGMSRIGPVYTPPEHRGRGYASGVVAAGSAHALAAGAAEVLLFTDLANPTSNSIYQKLGYEAVEDCVSLSFAR